MTRWLVCCLLLVALPAWAAPEPIVRVTVTPDEVRVGEAAELQVTVLVPTWFTKPPVYPSFELANAITRLPPDSSYPTSERIGSETWSGIVRSYRIWPLLDARYRISGETLTVTFANPGAAPVTAEVEVPEIVLRGTVPDGAAELDPYIAGRSLKLSLEVEGDIAGLEAGDALVLTYRAELDGMPAMFLPPLVPPMDTPGVSSYVDEPKLSDEPVASRTEKVTLVFEAGGEFEVPGFELDFWNTEQQRVENVAADGFTISVTGPPPAGGITPLEEPANWRELLIILGVTTISIFLLWWVLPRLSRALRAALQRRRLSEAHAYSVLRRSLRSGAARDVDDALRRWVERSGHEGGLRSFAIEWGDDHFVHAIDGLMDELYGRAQAGWQRRGIRRAIAHARKRRRLAAGTARASDLPPLNPPPGDEG